MGFWVNFTLQWPLAVLRIALVVSTAIAAQWSIGQDYVGLGCALAVWTPQITRAMSTTDGPQNGFAVDLLLLAVACVQTARVLVASNPYATNDIFWLAPISCAAALVGLVHILNDSDDAAIRLKERVCYRESRLAFALAPCLVMDALLLVLAACTPSGVPTLSISVLLVADGALACGLYACLRHFRSSRHELVWHGGSSAWLEFFYLELSLLPLLLFPSASTLRDSIAQASWYIAYSPGLEAMLRCACMVLAAVAVIDALESTSPLARIEEDEAGACERFGVLAWRIAESTWDVIRDMLLGVTAVQVYVLVLVATLVQLSAEPWYTSTVTYPPTLRTPLCFVKAIIDDVVEPFYSFTNDPDFQDTIEIALPELAAIRGAIFRTVHPSYIVFAEVCNGKTFTLDPRHSFQTILTFLPVALIAFATAIQVFPSGGGLARSRWFWAVSTLASLLFLATTQVVADADMHVWFYIFDGATYTRTYTSPGLVALWTSVQLVLVSLYLFVILTVIPTREGRQARRIRWKLDEDARDVANALKDAAEDADVARGGKVPRVRHDHRRAYTCGCLHVDTKELRDHARESLHRVVTYATSPALLIVIASVIVIVITVLTSGSPFKQFIVSKDDTSGAPAWLESTDIDQLDNLGLGTLVKMLGNEDRAILLAVMLAVYGVEKIGCWGCVCLNIPSLSSLEDVGNDIAHGFTSVFRRRLLEHHANTTRVSFEPVVPFRSARERAHAHQATRATQRAAMPRMRNTMRASSVRRDAASAVSGTITNDVTALGKGAQAALAKLGGLSFNLDDPTCAAKVPCGGTLVCVQDVVKSIVKDVEAIALIGIEFVLGVYIEVITSIIDPSGQFARWLEAIDTLHVYQDFKLLESDLVDFTIDWRFLGLNLGVLPSIKIPHQLFDVFKNMWDTFASLNSLAGAIFLMVFVCVSLISLGTLVPFVESALVAIELSVTSAALSVIHIIVVSVYYANAEFLANGYRVDVVYYDSIYVYLGALLGLVVGVLLKVCESIEEQANLFHFLIPHASVAPSAKAASKTPAKAAVKMPHKATPTARKKDAHTPFTSDETRSLLL